MKRSWLIGLAIVALAAVPRVIGLEVGQVFAGAHPDEFPVAVSQRMLETGEPSWFLIAYGGGYHSPLQLFLRVLDGLGFDTVLEMVPQLGPETLYRLLLPLRAWSALLSTAAVALVFCAGRALAGTACGAIAALVLAAAPAAIRDAHLAKADAAAAFAAALVIVSVALPWRRSWPLAVASGFGCGLALGTKYMVGLFPAALLAAWRGPHAETRTGSLQRLLMFAIATAVTVLALNWFWLADPRKSLGLFLGVLESQYGYVRSPELAGALRPPLEYHALVSLRYGCGGLAALLAGPALVAALARSGATRVVGVAIFGQLLVLAGNPLVLSRNLSPILPGLAVAIGWLVTRLVERIRPRYRRPALAILAALLFVPPWYDGMRMALVMRAVDTRGLAAQWIEANVPVKARIVVWGGPPDNTWGPPDLGARKVYRRLDPSLWRESADFVVWYHYSLPIAAEALPPRVALGSPVAVFDPFHEGADPVIEPLDAFYLPLARFRGVERPGPRIEIYALGSR